MRAVTANEKYVLRFPVDAEVKDALFVKEINAVDLWNEIIISAHGYGEPGIMFKDRQHKYSTSSVYPNWTNIGTNPCSEIGMNDDSCRLMLVNYLSCVENPFTSEAIFNFEKLYEITYEAQRLLDDLVDLELIAVSKILIKIENDPEPDFIKSVEKETWVNLYNKGKAGRRTGLGFTALADTFAAMGFKYDSKEAMNLLKAISETKFKAEFDSSIDMAIQRGKFDDFDPKYENTSEFVIMMQNEYPELYNRMMKYGRRNISISTVAPAGSMSILLQTSSGIEPLYKIGYKRRKKINPSDKNVVVNFVDSMGDSWTEYDILHHGVTQWMKINNIVDVTLANQQSPYAGSTASEIDWVKRIELQALVQKYVTHSISSTINLPENVSLERVGEIYLEAWKQGLKGITVYREGSRSGVLISMDKSKELVDSEAETHAVRRPQSVDCDVIRFMNSSEKWIAFLGIVKGRPYEIFTGLAEDFPIPSFVEKGKVRRVKDNGKGSRYDFLYTDKAGYEQEIKGLNRTFNKVFWNYAKLISGLLRNRMHLLSLIHTLETLTTDNDNINTWMNGVVRILRKYIKDGTKDSKEGNCPNCGAVLQYSEGCLKCFACSFSKCG
jgi:ribonucleoside-diphosphate reductase alpha chain